MSDTATASNGVTSQYAAQVAGDLEHNLKERDRLNAEITLLKGQLDAVEKDRTVLLSLQEALDTNATAAGTRTAPAKSADRSKPAPPARTSRQAKAKKPSPAGGKTTAPRTAAATPAKTSLVSLIRQHLAEQTEPRSAAEVAQSLVEQHPARGIKATVVRTTLEGLVAKSHAQRTKQGGSVFYTSSTPPQPGAQKEGQSV